jgi:prepilin-type N-terminal cleavage/methylation domain-containing protein
MKMRKLYKDQRGFTLIEILMVLVLIGIITGGITAAISQVLTINTRASNHMIAVRQVQQAGKEVSKDALQAQPNKIDNNPSGGNFLVLNWTDSEGLENMVVYTIDDDKLKRSHTVNGTAQTTAPTVIAQYIDPAQTSCCCDCNGDGDCDASCNCTTKVLIFTVTATVGSGSYEAIETRVYEIEPRPSPSSS